MACKSSLETLIARIQDVVEFLDIPIRSVDQRGMFGNTPLTVVVSWNDVDAARMLLDAGADVDQRSEDGDTALHRAVMFENADMVKLLLDHGASSGLKNDEGRSPSDIANELKLFELNQIFQSSIQETRGHNT